MEACNRIGLTPFSRLSPATGGAGKSFPGLTADMFQRRTSVVQFAARSLKKSVGVIAQFGAVEGLDAHGRSATIRFD